MFSNLKFGVIGCGKMADAILGGCFKKGILKNNNVLIYDVNKDACAAFSDKYNFIVKNSIEEIVKNSDVLFLAIKPFVVKDVLSAIKNHYKGQLICSIVAGFKIEKFLLELNNAKIIRIMPNTPALVGEGMSAVCSSNNVSKAEENMVVELMSVIGKTITTTEDKMDIITALSGSGPAFYFKIIDLMAKSAAKLGLNLDDALLLSAQTALGSAKMILNNNVSVNQLIANVTTKGGCTEVGNEIISNSDIDIILDKTIEATMVKSKNLA